MGSICRKNDYTVLPFFPFLYTLPNIWFYLVFSNMQEKLNGITFGTLSREYTLLNSVIG